MLRNSKPYTFKGKGVSDTLDGSNVFAGAMALAANMIPDPSTDDQWICRPAATVLTQSMGDPWSLGWSSGFGPLASASNGLMTAGLVVGSRLYGMMSSYMFGGGDDVPFCFDTSTNAFVPISGVLSTNVPASLQPTGDWIPPTMTLVGSKIMVCHQGFTGAAGNYVGQIDITTPATPAWSAGNLGGALSFTSAPYACGQFNGRAYYLVNPPGGQPAAIFSDTLTPLHATAGTQILTFGDNTLLTATAPLPLNSQLGGVVQSLIVFKGASNLYQITGDSATSNLAVNALNTATGTLAPNSISPTPKGLAFIAPDGLRLIDFFGRVSDPIGLAGSGINVPFINAVFPSRMNGQYGVNVYRISVQNGAALGSPTQEYWYDFARDRWSGPHSLSYAMIFLINNFFIGQATGSYGTILQSFSTPMPSSTYIENGVQLTFAWQTSMLPDVEDMSEHVMVETALMMALNPGDSYNASAVDQNNSVFDTVQLQTTGSQTKWGQFKWGQAPWLGSIPALASQWLEWHQPIVFNRLAVAVSGPSSGNVRIGNLRLRYQQLGYLQQTAVGA
jgi:hypothetical protein